MMQPIFKSEYINHVTKCDVVNVVKTYLKQSLLCESTKYQEQQALILSAATKAADYHNLTVSDVLKAIDDVELNLLFVVKVEKKQSSYKSEVQKIGEEIRVKIQNRLKNSQTEFIIN